MRFEEIIAILGEFGLYQKRLYHTLCLVSVFCAFQMMVPVFILSLPDSRCAVSDNDTYAVQDANHERLINCSIPWVYNNVSWHRETCKRYNTTGLECNEVHANTTLEDCSAVVYDTSIFQNTVITELNLGCGGEYLRSLANMLMMGGVLVGALGLGVVADIIGRKKVLMAAVLLQIGAGVGTALAPEYVSFVIFRFLAGVSNSGLFLSAFVIGMELVGPGKRAFAGIVIEFYWCAGLFILGGVAYGLRDWRHLQLAISVPAVLLIGLYWVVPESPRWLLFKGRNEEAEEIIRKAAATNHVTLPEKLFDQTTLADDGPKGKFHMLLTSPKLCARTLIIFVNWCVASMVYYGLGLNVGNLSGDVYLNFTIANAAELASYVISILLLDRLGRKWLHCGSMLLGGLACLATIFPVLYGGDSLQWVTVLLSMIGKLGASAAFAVIYVFTAELFPTAVRNSAMGVSSCAARVGSMLSPYIADLGTLVETEFGQALPLIVFGSLAVLAGGLALFLPETLNRKLPETVEEAKHFGQDAPKRSQDKRNCYTINVGEEKSNVPGEKYIKTIETTHM